MISLLYFSKVLDVICVHNLYFLFFQVDEIKEMEVDPPKPFEKDEIKVISPEKQRSQKKRSVDP